MAKALSPVVLILGQDSLRSDRALETVLSSRGVQPSAVVRIWGDESSFPEVFAAVTSRSLFSDETVVVVRRAEKLRGADKGVVEDKNAIGDDADDADGPAPIPDRAKGKRSAPKSSAGMEVPELDPGSTLILIARKADRRGGIWRQIGKAAEVVDAEYLKGRDLIATAAGEAKSLGLRLSLEQVRELVDQSGPSLGRIVSELEKIVLYEGVSGRGGTEGVAVTSSPPLYRLADAILLRSKGEALQILDEALRQGEPALRVVVTAHGTIRKLALFRALTKAGRSSAEAGAAAGILPFKIRDTERATRAWSGGEIGRALALLAEADRRVKLSGPVVPLLTHMVASLASGGRH